MRSHSAPVCGRIGACPLSISKERKNEERVGEEWRNKKIIVNGKTV